MGFKRGLKGLVQNASKISDFQKNQSEASIHINYKIRQIIEDSRCLLHEILLSLSRRGAGVFSRTGSNILLSVGICCEINKEREKKTS